MDRREVCWSSSLGVYEIQEGRQTLIPIVLSEVRSYGQKTVYIRGEDYYLYNGHGDVVQIVDASGEIVNNYTYVEWGNITSQSEGYSELF